MTPKELAQYPYATQIAITYITEKIIKVQKHQSNLVSKESIASTLVVMNNGPYQVRAVLDSSGTKGQLVILKNFKPYTHFNYGQYQTCALRFIELVQELELEKVSETL